MNEAIRTGGCLCGHVRYSVRGEPYKSGLCHCTDCRQVTGSAFLAYADWRPDQFEYTGQVATYRGRSFCPTCGSRLFSLNDHQAEIYLALSTPRRITLPRSPKVGSSGESTGCQRSPTSNATRKT